MTAPLSDNTSTAILPRLIYTGFAATLVGIGLGRFSFVALIPVLIQGGWANGDVAGFLAASNLLGYLIGALGANPIGRRLGAPIPLTVAMLACSLSFFAAAWNGGAEWQALWRLVAGISGGILMVLAAPTVLKSMPSRLKGRAMGIVFSGIGVGVAISGVAVPWAAELGVTESWLVLGALCMAATLPCLAFLNSIVDAPGAATEMSHASRQRFWSKALIALAAAYALDAIGYIPHTIYWSDFLVRSLGHSNEAGGWSWSVFGLGAIAGPMIAGFVADRFGFRRTLLGAFAIKTFAVLIPVISQNSILLSLSVLLVGALTPGIVALVSGTAAALAGAANHARAWGYVTFTFAVSQALGGYFIAGLYQLTDSHFVLFAAGAGALTLGTLATVIILLLNPPKA